MTASKISSFYNTATSKLLTIGIDSPLVVKTLKGKRICQKGQIVSACISMTPLLNAGTSGATYAASDLVLNLEIEANLTAQSTVFGIPQDLDPRDKIEWVKKQFRFLVKAGDLIDLGQSWFCLKRNDVEVDGEVYNKGTGEFVFQVLDNPKLDSTSVRFEHRADQATTAQVTLKVRGKHLAKSQVEKMAADAIKIALVPMPSKLRTLQDLYMGGVLMFEVKGTHEESVLNILQGGGVRVPCPQVLIGAEGFKGAAAYRNMVACHKFIETGESYVIEERVIDTPEVSGNVVMETDAQIAYANSVTEKQCTTVTFARALSRQVWEKWKLQHADTKDMSFVEHDGLFLVFHTYAVRFGALHLTVELSSTLENRSWKGGKIYLEALATLNAINPHLGRVLWLTGASSRRKIDMMMQCMGVEEVTKKLPRWTHSKELTLKSGTLKDVLSSLPQMVEIQDTTNNWHVVSFGLSSIIGMTPSGGTNTVARAGRDIALHFAEPVEERSDTWAIVLNQLLGAWKGALTLEMSGGGSDRSKLLKDSTKSGNVLSTLKVRGINTAWAEQGKVYLSSKDKWAKDLKGKTIIYQRNPIVGYFAAEVVLVGTDDLADLRFDREVLAPGVLYVEHEDWYRCNNGDDDGDLVSFIVLDDLMEWIFKRPQLILSDPDLKKDWGHLIEEEPTE